MALEASSLTPLNTGPCPALWGHLQSDSAAVAAWVDGPRAKFHPASSGVKTSIAPASAGPGQLDAAGAPLSAVAQASSGTSIGPATTAVDCSF